MGTERGSSKNVRDVCMKGGIFLKEKKTKEKNPPKKEITTKAKKVDEVNQNKAEEPKNKTDKKGLAAIKEEIENLPESKKFLAEKLLKEVSFMEKTLRKLQKTVKDEGAIIEAVNGNGFKTKSEHPAQKSYNSMIKNYTSAIKGINEILPKDNDAEYDDELLKFIRK